jgi:hypothetical protein
MLKRVLWSGNMITAKEVVSTNYSLDIPVDKMLEIMRKDGNCTVPLYIWLSNIKGVYSVDYNGHFGPHIFLSVEIEHDDAEVWDLIFKTIENYL